MLLAKSIHLCILPSKLGSQNLKNVVAPDIFVDLNSTQI